MAVDPKKLLDLKQLLDNAKRRGYMGVALCTQGLSGPGKRVCLARCLDRNGRVCDPTTWDTHETPEDALRELSDLLTLHERERRSA